MSEKVLDRRVKRTRKLLIGGLTQLMAQKRVKDITVRELAELVDINRGTFYLHYYDIFDMVEQIQKELFEEFDQTVSKYSPITTGDSPLSMVEDVFQFVKSNSELCRVMLGPHGDMAFLERFKTLVKEKSLRDWPQVLGVNKADDYEYYIAFIVSGAIGIVYEWLDKGALESPKDMAKLMTDMIISGISSASKQ